MQETNNQDNQKTLFDRFVMWWTIRTVVGCLIGTLILIAPLIVIPPLGKMFNFTASASITLSEASMIIAVPLYGVFVGYIQRTYWLEDFLPRRNWLIANGASIVTGLLSGLFLLQFGPSVFATTPGFNRELDGYGKSTLSPTWWITIIQWSLVLGVCSSIPLWYMLRQAGYIGKWIISAEIIGYVLLFTLAVMVGSVLNYSVSFAYSIICGIPLIIGAAAGIAIKKILQRT